MAPAAPPKVFSTRGVLAGQGQGENRDMARVTRSVTRLSGEELTSSVRVAGTLGWRDFGRKQPRCIADFGSGE